MNLTELETQSKAAREAGFEAAATELDRKTSRARKMAIAYEHYRFVTQEQVDAFQKKTREQTERPATAHDAHKLANDQSYYHATMIADQLVFKNLAEYAGLPPSDVISKVKTAKERACFDGMEVAEVEPVATEVKLPDPIVFGRIEGCTDRFYIAEWGTDVNINDLIGSNQG